MSDEPFQLPDAEVRQLLASRDRAGAAAAAAAEVAPVVAPTQLGGIGVVAPVPEVTGECLIPIVKLASFTFRRMGAEPIADDEQRLWADSCAPVMNKHGGKLPMQEEIVFGLVSAMVFGPRCVQAWDAWHERKAQAKAAKAAEEKAA